MLPPCISKPRFLDQFPLGVPDDDTREIREMKPVARMKKMAEDSASVLRLMEVAHVLARGEFVSMAELRKARDAQKAAEDKASSLEIALGISRDKLKKKSEAIKEKVEAWEEEKKRLTEEINAKWAPAEDEDESTSSFVSQADFVAKIDAMQE